MNYKEIGRYLQENIKGIYFGVELTCKYGKTYSCSGEEYKFIMWRNVIITEYNVLSIEAGSLNEYENNIIKQIFKLLKTEFFHVGSDEFDNTREYYKIITPEEEIKELSNALDDLKNSEIELVDKSPKILISDCEYNIFDWYADADPENSLDIDRQSYETVYNDEEL